MGNQNVKPNVPLLILIAAISAAIGTTPYLLFVGALWLLPIPAIIAAAAMWLSSRKFKTAATFDPTAGEWISAAWGRIAYAAISSFSLIYYAVAYWLTELVRFLLGLFDIPIASSWSSSIGLGVSAFFAIAFFTGYVAGSTDFIRILYPRLAGIRTSHYAIWMNYRVWIVLGIIVGLAAVFLLLFYDLREWYWITAASAVLFYSSIFVASSGQEREQQRKKGLEAIELLLAATDWNTAPLKSTGDPELDPFTAGIDFVATRNGDSMLIEVVAAKVDWTVASGLQTATRILEEGLIEEGSESDQLRPLLVMLNKDVDESVKRFAELEGVEIAHVPPAEITRILAVRNDPSRLVEIARDLIPATGGKHVSD